MKILISAHVIWWNASAYYAIMAALALTRRGHDVTVLAHSSTPSFQKAREYGLKTIGRINILRQNPLDFFRNVGALVRLLKQENYDILNPHRPEDHFYLGLAKRRLSSPVPLVRTVSDVRSPKGNPFNKVLIERWTDGLIFCADVCRGKYVGKFRLDSVPQKIIYSGLDVQDFIRGDWKSNNPFLHLSSPRIGIIARLSPNKGHRILIDAAAIVLKELKTASFIVVGREEEVSVAELKEYARSRGVLDAFTFTGHLDDPRPALVACQAGVVASLDSEVISRAAQEFFAFGVPVVASRINVLPEMVHHGINGLLVRPGDVQEMAAGIVDLLGSEERRGCLSRAAAKTAINRHDLSVVGRETEAFFQAILRGEDSS